ACRGGERGGACAGGVGGEGGAERAGARGAEEGGGMIEFYRRRPVLAVFAGAYSVAVLVMGVRAGEPSRIWWWLGAIPFLAWVASPIVVGLWLAEALKALSTRLIFFAALVGVGIYGYADQW